MKRTAAAFVLVAGLGGCVSPGDKSPTSGLKPFGQLSKGKEVAGVMGPDGGPMHAAPAAKSGVVQASGTAGGEVQQAAGFSRIIGRNAHTPGVMSGCATGDCGTGGGYAGGGYPNGGYGPTASRFGMATGHAGGILPAPGMGVPGAVAYPGGMGGMGGGGYGPMYANQRTSVRFVNPAGMKVSWLAGTNTFTDTPLEAPARYNFPQGSIYKLRLSGIPNRPGKTYYPSLEVYHATPASVTFLSHSTVPVSFTDEDFEQVNAGQMVTKVVYLPNVAMQDIAAAGGLEEIVSTRLEPGVDPIVEANRRGTILAVVRIGNIDLQDPNTPAMDAPAGVIGGAPRTSAAPLTPSVPMAPSVPPASLPPSAKPPVPAQTTGINPAIKVPTVLPALRK